MFFAALTVLASAGLFATGCDEYDDVPPRSSGGLYDLLPIVGESASAEELETCGDSFGVRIGGRKLIL